MLEMILGVQSLLILVLIGFIIWRGSRPADNSAATLIKQDITNLSDSVTKLKDGLNQQINERLDKEPGLVNSDPYGEGWMIRVRPNSQTDVGQLLDAGAYGKHIGA